LYRRWNSTQVLVVPTCQSDWCVWVLSKRKQV
jgi:hypothetical protein